MRLPLRIAPFLLGLMLAACSGIEVNTQYDPQAVPQIDSFKTYAWLPQPEGKDPRLYNDIINSYVREAVDADLAKRGFKQVDPGANPDFKIGWQGAIDNKVDIQTVNSYYGYYWDPMWSPYYAGAGAPYTYAREYEQGTLILDFVDAKSNKLVWRGTAQAEVNENPSASRTRGRINEAVEEMLAHFPPKEKK
ncbi:DUF4136 domain-containing protein [Pyxidicoccus parkwayensis]|uniref:DUF4136 domain-containing protein n=1 Tax=Pyxidicoccus parkwayensis TaxID=2813578 RepID=A0ABX7P4F3_9BACT|nr:DUF4136 domain-containing protein [Pyxidicoccus parkwaysis]QSQ25372.1 DUF4136 domain-containing protein [Pyxidicoccus parkwaysis]